MKLFLSGGGSKEQSESLDKAFADSINKKKPLLYIPIAINNKKHPYPECLIWLKDTFDKLGVTNYTMWDEKDLYLWQKEEVTNFSGIYIGGGNTPYLLKTLKDTGCWNFIKEAVSKSVPIYGGSAGAIIFAKTIIPCLILDENFVGLKDMSAMNMLNEKELWAHYEPENDKIIKEFTTKYDLKEIIALPEETGIVLENNSIKILGKKSAFIFSGKNKKEIKSGEIIK
jgi:dipeptidase E